MVELRVVAGRSAGKRTAIGQFPFTIGRSTKAGLCLSDAGVWDQHAVVIQSDDGSFVIRPDSDAVVTLEGAGITEHRLRNGDVFDCGGAKIRFWISAAPARSLRLREACVWTLLFCVLAIELFLLIALS
jgi:predicted component of type VI protein secretion system